MQCVSSLGCAHPRCVCAGEAPHHTKRGVWKNGCQPVPNVSIKGYCRQWRAVLCCAGCACRRCFVLGFIWQLRRHLLQCCLQVPAVHCPSSKSELQEPVAQDVKRTAPWPCRVLQCAASVKESAAQQAERCRFALSSFPKNRTIDFPEYLSMQSRNPTMVRGIIAYSRVLDAAGN